MNIEKYTVTQLGECLFEFFSEGPRGKFVMRIAFSNLYGETYNVAFGVWDAFLDKIDDSYETRNGDMDKILKTVVSQIFDFLQQNRGMSVIAAGSNAARTRKYQIGISQNLELTTNIYGILGFIAERDGGRIMGEYPDWHGHWSTFAKDVRYDAFLIYLK